MDAQLQQLSQDIADHAVQPQVIDASASRAGAAANLTVLLPLGGLLGLLVGIAVAATREATSPTLGRDALARFLKAPVLAGGSVAPTAG